VSKTCEGICSEFGIPMEIWRTKWYGKVRFRALVLLLLFKASALIKEVEEGVEELIVLVVFLVEEVFALDEECPPSIEDRGGSEDDMGAVVLVLGWFCNSFAGNGFERTV
jgi:hypothetical protein